MAIDMDEFTYHAPDAVTMPKYEAIRSAEEAARRVIDAALRASYTPETRQGLHDAVNVACLSLAKVIDAEVPGCADKTVALRCVRHSRMTANEALVKGAGSTALLEAMLGGGGHATRLTTRVSELLLDARMWGCAAIAIEHAKAERANKEHEKEYR